MWPLLSLILDVLPHILLSVEGFSGISVIQFHK